MTRSLDPVPGTMEQRRERTIQALCRHVAADALTLEEFERRVDAVHRASTAADLDALLRDLPALQGPAAPTPAPSPATARADAGRRDHQIVAAVLGGADRRGAWTPARKITVCTFMGGTSLDFRDARLAPGVTEVTVVSIWGGVDIVVPPNVIVESGGIAILGAFEHADKTAAPTDPDAPRLRISGVSIMGGVNIDVRYPGETPSDARRRRRLERRARRALPG